MIACVSGDVLEIRPDALVVALGGAGLLVLCSPSTLAAARIGAQITLATSLVVREDSLTLFGFADADSRDMFDLVQTVSGFGPKLAFAVLAHLPADELRNAISREDVARLTATPGVGAKGAQRLILELKDRVGPAAFNGPGDVWQSQVAEALTGLGWSSRDAARAVAQLDGAHGDVTDLLRQALAILGPS